MWSWVSKYQILIKFLIARRFTKDIRGHIPILPSPLPKVMLDKCHGREREISMFNGTSTPKESYSAKTGVKLPYESKQSPLEKNAMVK